MDRYKETFETWNKVASLYQDKFMELAIYNDSYNIICNLLAKHQPHLLEIGCGPGNISRYLLKQRPDFIIKGIDIAPNMIELAKQNNPGADFSVMDCRNIHELNTTFDGIIAGFCLPYLSETDSEKIISDSRKLLNPGGIIYLSFVEGLPERSGYQLSSSGDRAYFYYHTLDSLTSILKSNGFSTIHIFNVPYRKSVTEIEIHTILIGSKNSNSL
jgi:SAM-dependent methyltransferase